MRSKSEKEYEVGYKKPPKGTQFRKGKSGNPSGRPNKAPQPIDPAILLETIDNEEIAVKIDGKWVSMKKAELQYRQLFAKAIKGNLATARLLAKMAFEYFAPEERGKFGYEAIGETEAARRFGPKWRKRIEEHHARLGLGR
jgi:hypothetical protein